MDTGLAAVGNELIRVKDKGSVRTGGRPESRQSEGRVEAESLSAKILQSLTTEALGKGEITGFVGKKKVDGRLNKTVRALPKDGLIEYIIPEKPQSRLQKHRLTLKGQKLLDGIQALKK